MRLSGVAATLRRGLTVVAALMLLLDYFPSFRTPLPRPQPPKLARSGCFARRSARRIQSRRSSAPHAITDSTRCSCRCADAATRTSPARSNRAPPICSGSQRVSIRSQPCSPARTRPALRVHAWVNVNLVSSATDLPIATTHLDPSSSRVADGAARSRAGTGEGARRQSRPTSASSRDGRAHRRSGPANAAAHRRPLRLADPSRRRRSRQRASCAILSPLRRRRRAPRLRALSERAVRLQPRRHPRVPRRPPSRS